MNAERWAAVEELLDRVLAAAPDARPALLETARDPELRQEVASLLAAHEAAGDFLTGHVADILPGWPEELCETPQRSRRPHLAVAATAIVVVVLLTGAGVFAWQAWNAARERRLPGGGTLAVARSLENLAHVEYETGHPAAAEASLRQALAIRERRLGKDHPDVAETLEKLARCLERRGRPEAAVPVLERALAIRQRVFGEAHPRVAKTLHGLGLVHAQSGDDGEAERRLRAALALWRADLRGKNRIQLASSLSALAHVLRRQWKLSEATVLLRQALDLGRQLVPPGNPGLASPLLDLGEVLLDQGDAAAAEPLLREAHALCRTTLPAESPLVARAQELLGKCLGRLGREAEPLLRERHATSAAAAPETEAAW